MTSLLGLYQPGTSPLHRLTPGPKLLAMMVLSIAVVAVKGPWTSLVFVALVLALAAIGRVSVRAMLRAVRQFAVVAVFLLVLGAWQRGWPSAIEFVVDMLALILAAAVLTSTTQVNDVLDTIVRALGPFRRFGVDPERVALVFSMTLRAVPATLELAAETRDAARARGLDRSIRARTTPLVVRVVARAHDTGDALHARGILD